MKKSLILTLIVLVIFSKAVFATELNFIDIENHWAKENIIKLSQNNVINGYSDNTFRPDEKVTIAEFLKMVIASQNYELIREGKRVWPDFYISTAKENNLLKQDFLDYNMPITRYEAVNIIAETIDLTSVDKSKNKFKDLKQEYKNNVLKLVELGILKGYSDKTFKGENNITRAEAITIIDRLNEAKNKISISKKYLPEKRKDLSNYFIDSDSVYFNYEIKNNNIYVYDIGKYSNSNAYKIDNRIINISKVIKVIKSLIRENTYTEIAYSPSKYTINQLRISHGESKKEIENGGADFIFTYYEDKYYELGNISMNDEFENNCYLKIEVIKMWRDYSDYENKKYVDDYKKTILLETLETEFGYQHAKDILEYMISKNIDFVSNVNRDIERVGKKQFGSYTICYYQKEYGFPTFYISKD